MLGWRTVTVQPDCGDSHPIVPGEGFMNALVRGIKIETTKAPDFIDITDRIEQMVTESRVQQGMVLVYSRHTTAAIKINENEPLLLQDMAAFLERMASRHGHYQHNDFTIRKNTPPEECPNGHAHCQHLLLGTSETIPIVDGKMPFGQWQRIFLVELDHPRPREVLVQILGE